MKITETKHRRSSPKLMPILGLAQGRQRNFQRYSSTRLEVYWIRKINSGGKKASAEDG